jgi:hypothetical protein
METAMGSMLLKDKGGGSYAVGPNAKPGDNDMIRKVIFVKEEKQAPVYYVSYTLASPHYHY